MSEDATQSKRPSFMACILVSGVRMMESSVDVVMRISFSGDLILHT